ncbi:MAG: alanine/glycine:cation symporter family protein [Verrucomicrobiales bacterium]|nr:alanine/glycine:cation symporter family protein [Verrucomicrobiales bacterium]
MSTTCRFLAFITLTFAPLAASAEEAAMSIADKIDAGLKPVADGAVDIVFFGIEVMDGVTLPIVLILLAATAIFLTLYFKFINLRGFGIALRTAKGKYTDPDAPGQITHFQALSAALSATVGLGNIGGVAVAIGIGGPGATFWMIVMGLCGMTTKFAECTLGVKYRRIAKDGSVKGGAMYYLRDGLKEIGMGPIGAVLAVMFAIFVIGGAFGAGNMFQSNQAFSQFSSTFLDPGIAGSGGAKLTFGIILAVAVGLVIIGGIVRIAHVTAFLVPFMCGIYVIAATIILLTNLGEIIPAISTIISAAFSNEAVTGGLVGILIQGVRRAAFSNEAGLGSAPIAHSAVKTDKPASEGFVALLEPFVDTVVVCTMTALVIVITGTWQVSAEVNTAGSSLLSEPGSSEVVRDLEAGQFLHTRASKADHLEVIGLVSPDDHSVEEITGWVPANSVTDRKGVPVTSMAFESVISWFPALLTIAVVLFAFSTMISWSYYGEQGVIYLFSFLADDKIKIPVLIYKVIFCLLIIVGASGSLANVLNLSDSMVFAMVIPNLIGLYFLLPVIKKEMTSYLDHVKTVDQNPE